MVKAFNMAGNTCYGTADNFDALKPQLDKLHTCNETDSSKSPLLIVEQDNDPLSRPIFQKIRIAHYKEGWQIK